MSRSLPRRLDTKLLPFALSALAGLAVAGAVAFVPSQPARAQAPLIAYKMVGQWPQRTDAASGLLQTPVDLDVSTDNWVFIADEGIGGVQTLLPTGVFTAPFGVSGGFPQQLGRVGQIAVGPNPPPPGVTVPPGVPIPLFGERVYVLDTATDRVVTYSTTGRFIAEWPKINAQSLAASIDLRVYVLDRDTSEVRVFDAVTGSEQFKFGGRGTEIGQFTNFTDIDVSADGRVVAVGDKRGQRVQLFDMATNEQMAADPMAQPAKVRLTYDLLDARFEQQGNRCTSDRINALGGDKVFVGQALGACVIDGRKVAVVIAASANKGAICRDTVTLPRLRTTTQAYFALASSNPNPGKCGDKRGTLDPSPVVVKYSDQELKQVDTLWEAASNDTLDNPLLFSPDALSMPQDGILYVSDSSSQLRFFSTDGAQVATSQRDSQVGSFSTDFQFFFIIRADGSDVLGEVMGYYIKGRRAQGQFTVEGGIGRFRTVEKRTQNGIEKVIEDLWLDPLISSFQQIEVPALAWNPISNELLVVRNETVAQTRTQDVKIVRYAPDGRKLGDFDLPDDGQSNPYVDMSVSPDGRIVALDDLNDRVRVYQPDGTHLVDVPVAFDARNVAGGPPSSNGTVFVMREPGSIERYADDGTVTARLDGRPLPFSDATTLTDLVVDKNGRVYVSDGQSSLISVFEETSSTSDLPIPGDGECLFRGLADAQPRQLPLGASTTVTYSLVGKCGTDEAPADIVVVVPYFPRIQPGMDPAATYITELTQMMARVNFGKHRVGLVSYYNTQTTELQLTGDRNAYIQAVRGVNRSDPSPNVKARLRDAMEEAQKQFTAGDGRRHVMVLLRAEYCTTETEVVPGQCAGIPPAEDAALAVRNAGTVIVVVNSFGAFDLASSDEDALFGVEGVHRRMVRYAPPEAMGKDLSLTSDVPNTMQVVPGSLSGGGAWSAPNLSWQVSSLGYAGLTASAQLLPQAGGTWPVANLTQAEFTDGFGKAQQVAFPIPKVDVAAPTPTPAADTPTPVPTNTSLPTATSMPTATPKPQAIYLPILFLSRCKPAPVPLDVVMVFDISSSMGGPALPAGPTKLAAAQGIGHALISTLGRQSDRVGIVSFDAGAHLVADLTSDFAIADRAVTGLGLSNGSRIDLGLAIAHERLQARRPAAKSVVVLFSDGDPSAAPELVSAEAAALNAAGITLFTVALGPDAKREFLAQLVDRPDRAFVVQDGAGLEPSFTIAHEIRADLARETVEVCE